MKNSVAVLLDEAKKKMSGYAALLNYRLMNLCVKASPEALLPISVSSGGEGLPLEKVAWAQIGDRSDQFEIFPMSSALLYPIVKAIQEVHPEFKIELKKADEEDDEEEADRYILATMPVVDDARHEVLKNGVAALCEACDLKMQLTFGIYTSRIVTKLDGADPEELDEAKDALQQPKDQHDDLCKQFKANKEDEIEEAYKRYQEAKQQKLEKLQEEQAAHNPLAAKQMKWNPEEDE